jgi:hypothetical protein
MTRFSGRDTAKKKARTGRAESIFLEEDRGDGSDYRGMVEINPIGISHIDYINRK